LLNGITKQFKYFETRGRYGSPKKDSQKPTEIVEAFAPVKEIVISE
jgi:hypothetical protein